MTRDLPPSARGPRLRIVCINDVYALEHLPRLKTLVRRHLETDPADVFITTLAGDFVGPSMLSSLDKGRGMIDCINAIPITHAIFGNHEDDIEPAELRRRIAEFRGMWLNTNMRGFVPELPAHDVLVVTAPGGRSVRVGLVGVVMGEPSMYRGAPFGVGGIEHANASAQREASRLMREDGCACVLPLTHQPLADDLELARIQRVPPFPVIIGGHEHEVFIQQLDGTWVVKAGADAVHAVVIDAEWPPVAPPASADDLPAVRVRLEDVANDAEDPDLRARVTAHMNAVRELEAATLMKLTPGETLSSVGTRMQQTSLGTLLCSRIRDALGADGCVFNGGGIRAGREYTRRFTYGDLKAEVPFENEVVVVRLPGIVVRKAIGSSRAGTPVESGGFLQVDDGIAVDAASNEPISIAGTPIDDARTYRIAMIRNLLTGMDRVEPLIRFARDNPGMVPPVGSGRDAKVILVDSFSAALWKQLGTFDSIDADHDGALSAPEISAAVERVTGEPASQITVDLLLRTFDKNRDRRVSRDEAAGVDGASKK